MAKTTSTADFNYFDSKNLALVPREKDMAEVEQESKDIINRVKGIQRSTKKGV